MARGIWQKTRVRETGSGAMMLTRKGLRGVRMAADKWTDMRPSE